MPSRPSSGLKAAAEKAAAKKNAPPPANASPVVAASPIKDMLSNPGQLEELGKAMPPGLSLERFVRQALTLIKLNPQLEELGASREGARSMIAAFHRCAQLGLEPGNDLGHAYLIPFRMQGKLHLQFIIGYKGVLHMARSSHQLRRLDVHEVYANDEFEYSYGVGGTLTHKPTLEPVRGDVIAYYGYAEFMDGGYFYTVLTPADIELRRLRSASVKAKKKSPWDTDYIAMAKKTVVRAMAPNLPLSPDEQAAIAMDEQEIRGDGSVAYIDVDAVEREPSEPYIDPETGIEDPIEEDIVDAEEVVPQDGVPRETEPEPPVEPETRPPGSRVCDCGAGDDAPPSAHEDGCSIEP